MEFDISWILLGFPAAFVLGWLASRFDLRQMDLTVYLRDPGDRATVEAVLAQALGAAAPGLRNALWLHADVCRADLLVELEAQGHARC